MPGTTLGHHSLLCEYCRKKPKFNDGTKLHAYCGKTCAQRFKAAFDPKFTIYPGATCTIPGCQNVVYVDLTKTPSKYCSLSHKRLAGEACLWCKKEPKQFFSHFCSRTCANSAQDMRPGLLEVPRTHVTFKSVADQFKASWRHATKAPCVQHVYKIIMSPSSIKQYEAYRDQVESRGKFKNAGLSAGNESRRWHGTRRDCLLGDMGHAQFCASASCPLCNIIKSSFDISFVKKNTGGSRFGVGIYTSSTSSNSNGYSNNTVASNLKAVILNNVVVGKGYKVYTNQPTLTQPPAGYDSVLAEVCNTLDFDELVVFRNDAIRPSFLVMYDA